jgi:ribosomal protein S18 acetylase RimI-like enzyme
VWKILKLVFRDVNRETVEYQRPRLKKYFYQIYEEEGVEQLLFELKRNAKYELVGYAEYAYDIAGTDNWMNQRYFEKRGMRPLFVEELAVHPEYHNLGIGSFMYEQIEHAARLRGRTHIVLEVAENNEEALKFYRGRNFYKLDAAIFLARKLETEQELLPPRRIRRRNAP